MAWVIKSLLTKLAEKLALKAIKSVKPTLTKGESTAVKLHKFKGVIKKF